MVQFQYPEAFLLLIPLAFAYRRWAWATGMTAVVRIALLLVLVTALSVPEINVGGRGLDVIVVADRSRSMSPGDADRVKELVQNLERNRGVANRVGLVTFGSQPLIEHPLSNTTKLDNFVQEVQPDGSDLNSALHLALNLVDPNRPARLLVLTDGEYNAASPNSAARRARELTVPIDYRLFERIRIGDSAIESVLVPEVVAPREPFQFSVWVHADRATTGTVRVSRGDKEIAKVERDLQPGMNRLIFRDILEEGGTWNYSVQLEIEGDPIPENNTGAAVVRVDAGPKLLLLTNDGDNDSNLARQLRAGKLSVDVVKADQFPLTQDALDKYRAVVIENVPAGVLGRLKLERLAQFVEDLGGGLMLTGGERSFGTGGYFKSALDPVLPVSMEMRQEHRKTNIAIAVALDRSGSMSLPVRGGKVKMDLADLGTAECVKMLSPGDSVAVIAVDSAPHIIQALTPVDDPGPIVNKVLKIQSMGGGIFVYEALVAAGKELAKADQATKHIILFSDAADSEEPGDYKNLLRKFTDSGITVSVIGLGKKTDSDARLLEDVAKLGNGRISFTDDAEELPRLFTEDTMTVARSSFIKKDGKTQANGITGQFVPDNVLLGALGAGRFPRVDGYNLSYLKPDATAAVISTDEYAAPWSAFWYRGLGRVAAVAFEVDGKHSGEFAQWDKQADFLLTQARWLLGSGDPQAVFVQLERDGQDARVIVELDPERVANAAAEPPRLRVIPPGNDRAAALEPDLIWTGPNTLEARFPMLQTGTYRTLVQTGARNFTRGPVVTLPYSPEHVPRLGLPSGKAALKAVADLSQGKPRTDVLEIFRDIPRAARTLSLLPWLFAASVILLLLEIAGRRLSLWDRLPDFSKEDVAMPVQQPARIPQPPRRTVSPRKPTVVTATAPSSPDTNSSKAPVSTNAAPATANDIYEQAKRRAQRRM